MQPTHFTFVRHGQTNWNLQKKVHGHKDIPLNETGKKQALELAKTLAKRTFNRCYSSDLSRATETAKLLVGSKLTVIKDPLLKERDVGPFVGKGALEIVAHLKKPGQTEIETNEQMVTRIKTFIQKISKSYPGIKCLVVTHGGVIRNLVSMLTGQSVASFKVPNTSILTLSVIKDTYKILEKTGIE